MSSEDKVKSKRKTKDTKIVEEVVDDEPKTSSFCKQPKKAKVQKEEKNIDTTFVLKDINYINLDRSYGMKDIQNFIFKNSSKDTIITETSEKKNNDSLKNLISSKLSTSNKNEIKSITTKLENLGFSDKIKEPFETIIRGNVKSNIYTTFNNTIKKELVSNCCSFTCWYCRHSLINNTLPVIIPLKYYNSYSECSLVHNSLINTIPKLEYKIFDDLSINLVKDKEKIFYEKVNLTQNDKNKLKNSDPDKSVKYNDYFEGEGTFCSFNCAVAYVSDNYSIKYKNTGMLINKLYKHIFGFLPKEKIVPSPSWKMLKDYGGEFTIEEYRKSFQIIDYSYNWQYLKNFPNGPVSELFLEKKLA